MSEILIDRAWPRQERATGWLRDAVLVVAGIALIAVSARIHVALPMVPMTMQTLAVLLVAAAYGVRLGVITVVLYIAAGALGLPVFAGSAGGLAYLKGPTAGFLAGFVVAAAFTARAGPYGWDRSFWRMLAVMTVAHIVILALGHLWLAYGIGLGSEKAWRVGVAPFVAGAVVKSLLGAALLPVLDRLAGARQGAS